MPRGSEGRTGIPARPDPDWQPHELFAKCNISMPQDLMARLEKFCADEERARSWVIQKAVDAWLKTKGY